LIHEPIFLIVFPDHFQGVPNLASVGVLHIMKMIIVMAEHDLKKVSKIEVSEAQAIRF
jgi:hypothetical protein